MPSFPAIALLLATSVGLGTAAFAAEPGPVELSRSPDGRFALAYVETPFTDQSFRDAKTRKPIPISGTLKHLRLLGLPGGEVLWPPPLPPRSGETESPGLQEWFSWGDFPHSITKPEPPAFAWSPDGQWLVVGKQRKIELYALDSTRLRREYLDELKLPQLFPQHKPPGPVGAEMREHYIAPGSSTKLALRFVDATSVEVRREGLFSVPTGEPLLPRMDYQYSTTVVYSLLDDAPNEGIISKKASAKPFTQSE